MLWVLSHEWNSKRCRTVPTMLTIDSSGVAPENTGEGGGVGEEAEH